MSMPSVSWDEDGDRWEVEEAAEFVNGRWVVPDSGTYRADDTPVLVPLVVATEGAPTRDGVGPAKTTSVWRLSGAANEAVVGSFVSPFASINVDIVWASDGTSTSAATFRCDMAWTSADGQSLYDQNFVIGANVFPAATGQYKRVTTRMKSDVAVGVGSVVTVKIRRSGAADVLNDVVLLMSSAIVGKA